jgi:ribosomal protein S18 acetylase RimI-like enzyme
VTIALSVRAALPADLDHLARLWHDAWYETHAALMPVELARLRTLESFRDRLAAALGVVRVVGPAGAPVGFCIVKGDELYQLWVSPEARGTGVAAALIADAEARMAASGLTTAWLACAIGNTRAARFYEKAGWRNVGTASYAAETSEGPTELQVWRFERSLGPPRAS